MVGHCTHSLTHSPLTHSPSFLYSPQKHLFLTTGSPVPLLHLLGWLFEGDSQNSRNASMKHSRGRRVPGGGKRSEVRIKGVEDQGVIGEGQGWSRHSSWTTFNPFSPAAIPPSPARPAQMSPKFPLAPPLQLGEPLPAANKLPEPKIWTSLAMLTTSFLGCGHPPPAVCLAHQRSRRAQSRADAQVTIA